MIKYVVKENKNKKSPAYGKWYAYPIVEETMNLAALAKHMEEHNTGFSEAMCLGMMTADGKVYQGAALGWQECED